MSSKDEGSVRAYLNDIKLHVYDGQGIVCEMTENSISVQYYNYCHREEGVKFAAKGNGPETLPTKKLPRNKIAWEPVPVAIGSYADWSEYENNEVAIIRIYPAKI